MIIGIGTDLCAISRIEKAYDRFGQRFMDRICTRAEQMRITRNRLKLTARLAQHFAAKEASSKALGTGFRQGVFWSDLEVVHLPSGQPTLIFHNGAKARLDQLLPAGHLPDLHLTLSDEADLANAVVVISARPGAH